MVTMMDRIKELNIDQMARFICNVRKGILEDEIFLSCCTGKHFIDFDESTEYDMLEFVKDYLSSLIDF